MSLPFLRLSEEERAEWRGLPVTTELVALVEFAESACADAIIAAVRKGVPKEAEILAGKLEAIQTFKEMLAKRMTPVNTEEDATFVDPAAIWSVT